MEEPPRSVPRLSYLLGTAALAGISGAGFAVIAAHALGLSKTIAGTTSGVLLAVIVGVVIYKYGETRPNEKS